MTVKPIRRISTSLEAFRVSLGQSEATMVSRLTLRGLLIAISSRKATLRLFCTLISMITARMYKVV